MTPAKRANSSPYDTITMEPIKQRFLSHACRVVTILCVGTLGGTLAIGSTHAPGGARPLVIVTSPSVKHAIEELGKAFESTHPDVNVEVVVDGLLDLRQKIAAIQNRGTYFIGSGPIHLIAPGGDELITRLEQKYYVLPGTKVLYATEQIVLIAPESLNDAPESFSALTKMKTIRIAVADLSTRLGVETNRLLSALGLRSTEGKRLDVAGDQAGILDHVLNGQADVGIMFGHEALRLQQRVRIVAKAPIDLYTPIQHSIAMERYCPDRELGEEFLQFVAGQEGQLLLERLGYGPGKPSEIQVRVPVP